MHGDTDDVDASCKGNVIANPPGTESSARTRDHVRAEVTKILTYPAAIFAIALAFLANTGLSILSAADVIRLSTGANPAPLSELGGVMFAPVYIFLFLPTFASGSEHLNGQLRVTLVAMPRRSHLAWEKLAAMLTVEIPAAIGTVLPGRAIVGASDGATVMSIVESVVVWSLAYTLMSIIAFALAGLIRSAIASLSILALMPILVATGVFQWPEVIRILPDQLSLSLIGSPGYESTALPVGTAASFLVAWAVVGIALYVWMFRQRDS